MGDLQLVFLQYADRTPSLAGCANCHLKFFTPQQLMKQPQAAAESLREKFARHTCKGEIFEETRAGTVQARRLRIMKPADDISPWESARFATCDFRLRSYFRDLVDRQRNIFGDNLTGTGVRVGRELSRRRIDRARLSCRECLWWGKLAGASITFHPRELDFTPGNQFRKLNNSFRSFLLASQE